MPSDPELFRELYVAAFPVVVTAYFNGTLAKAFQAEEVASTDVAMVTNDLASLAHQYLIRSLESLPQGGLNLPSQPSSVASTAPPSKVKPVKHHHPWTAEEDTRLVSEFNSTPDIKSVAALHDRSELAIKMRLIKLGLLTG
jgi:hypothetical protein